MKNVIGLILLFLSVAVAAEAATSPSFDEKAAERFAKLALACVRFPMHHSQNPRATR
jgi:hypothetical protein